MGRPGVVLKSDDARGDVLIRSPRSEQPLCQSGWWSNRPDPYTPRLWSRDL